MAATEMTPLRRIWHDPVWSKVIAGVILAGMAGLYARSDAAVAQLGRFGEWLGSPSRASNGDVVFFVALGMALGAIYGLVDSLLSIFKGSASRTTITGVTTVHGPDSGSRNDEIVQAALPVAQATNQQEEGAVAPEPAVASNVTGPSGLPTNLDEMSARVSALNDRFYEAEEYKKQCVGRRVVCTGSVFNVSAVGENISVALNREGFGGLVHIWFPAAFRLQAFTLQRDDLVTVVGTLRNIERYGATVDGEELTRNVIPG